jgi:glycosyltransferase involved in cell wall biosynthesis
MKTICIDARMWGVKHTGIGVYVEQLIANLPQSKDYQVVLVVTPESEKELRLNRFKKYVAYRHPYSNLAQFEMVWLLWKIKPDVLHVPHFTIPVLWSGKIIITIHDLIKHISKGADTTTRHPLIYWFKYFQYLLIVWFAVSRAERIIVPTTYWQEILMANYNLPKEKIAVTSEGVSEEFFNKTYVNIDLPEKPYVLYVGNVYPHKNLNTLLAAIGKLNGSMLLIIVCARSIFTQRAEKLIEKHNLQKWVKFLGSVSEKELVSLYKNARALVFPSLIEGFGLPGLEAMAVGTPVIAANSSCLPEVYEDAAEFFEPLDSSQLAQKIAEVHSNIKLRTTLIAKGKKQVKKYSWAKMAQQTWQIYQDVSL